MRTTSKHVLAICAGAIALTAAGAAVGEEFSYDALGRLERVDAGGKLTRYTYDRAGNRLSRIASGFASAAPRTAPTETPSRLATLEGATPGRTEGQRLDGDAVRLSARPPERRPTTMRRDLERRLHLIADNTGGVLTPAS